ncbi:tyrosine-type recombinase/integrase [Paenibacillus sp. LHD-117]|uniref:site-specific integrase n=1 Tax=Paenibacillus sp. LHD-117 TaxID=3071412 RepID=UPI0027DFC17A|nr:tyrosine-type recombinase/integrase [Paenibacillus sp. LHD-117]MDQ6418706.1 tyrosine-type recombinase/integrase [Paenibacillus sp. LHD-117]
MASFQKRGKTWEYRISRTVNGKRSPISKGGFATKKAAQVAANEAENKLHKGMTPILKSEGFSDYFESWIDLYKPAIANNTRERYLNTRKTIADHFGSLLMKDITKQSYQEFLNQYASTRSRETAKKLNTHIRACVKDAIDDGLLHVDFTRGVRLSGSVPAKRPEEKHLNYNDSVRLIKELTSNLSAVSHYLIFLALMSGMRFSELVGLTKSDFNFGAGEINITKTWGYTNKMHAGFGPTKNPQSVRTIKMDKSTMEIMQGWIAQLTDTPHNLVFYSPDSKYKVVSNNAVNKSLEHALARLKIDPISIHGLRHTHASILLYKDVSIYYVSERLGHSDIETTMEYYAHIIKELRIKDEKNTLKVFNGMIK